VFVDRNGQFEIPEWIKKWNKDFEKLQEELKEKEK